MSLTLTLLSPAVAPALRKNAPPSLLDALLQEQQRTAVEQFSQWHARETPPLQKRYYRDLIPAAQPKPGEQYAFEVDLDACSGCKACVVACHNLNGLEEEETWRAVGLLHGGESELPILQHVTTACHHCVEPACLEGCPVEAYVKDAVTGIVRHLDDQCIGCQYCILKCPYDVPKYSSSKGIVRKCDMCTDRLAVGEAPACVQACPNQAIRISVVSQHSAIENAEANLFLPGAPEPGYTLPTTIYKSRRPMPANLLPADYFAAKPQHAHWPLILMLVLTQMSVGAFVIDQLVRCILPMSTTQTSGPSHAVHLATSFALGMLGLAASTLHLGRPWLAYRAIIGWKRSWLSREVIAFGLFAGSASAYSLLPWSSVLGWGVPSAVERSLGFAVAASGLAGVFCSAMIYASTRRAFWNAFYTGLKFLLTGIVLGAPLHLLIQLAGRDLGTSSGEGAGLTIRLLCMLQIVASAIKLLAELAILTWLRSPTFTPLRRTAILMTGALARVTNGRVILGVLGGMILPALVYAAESRTAGSTSLWLVGVSAGALLFSLGGELLERYLFFAAVVAPKMPGAPST